MIAVGALLLAIGVFGAWRVHRLHKRSSDILAENVSSIRAAEELEGISHKLRYRLKRFLSTRNERHLAEIATLIPEARQWLQRTEEFGKTTREQQFVEQVGRGFQQFVADFNRLTETAGEQRTRLAEHMADRTIPEDILAYTQRYISLNEEELAHSSRRNQSTANQLMFGLLLLGTCGGVTGLLAGYVIARRVSRTIVQLSLPIRAAAGKLDKVAAPISVSADPSFEDLESILKTVSQRVTSVVERLQENEREMLRAEQLAAVGQLAAGLAHELRNPLTSLKTILQLADTADELTDRDLDVLKQEITRLEGSVQTFLDFARPPHLEMRVVEFDQLLDETVELVAPRAERQGVHLDYCFPPEPIAVMADATQLRQVVLNLLLNAFDAVPQGGTVRVEAAVRKDPSIPGHSRWRTNRSAGVLLSISDSGPGLPAQLGDRIFDPFVSTKESGSGLGLSICKKILEAHGGEITAADGRDGGAVFTVRLPLADNRTTADMDSTHVETVNRG